MALRRIFGGGGAPRFPADWLVVGLGNPGEKYAGTRHNVGAWAANAVAKRLRIQPKQTGSLMAIAAGELDGTRIAVVKPKTFMNDSGKAVAQALQWTGVDISHTIVMYDELDLTSGAIRIRAGGGHGGHNGLRDIGAHAGLDFVRVRIGIGRPFSGGEPSWDSDVVIPWVLGEPRGEERQRLDETVAAVAEAVEVIIKEGPDIAGSRFNRR
ncbi:MAG: aminoacyl-tRNA hydrolase [Tepidiformaceae bacterium]